MNFSEVNPHDLPTLSVAVEFNSVSLVRRLISWGRNVDNIDNRGWAPLHEAAALGHIDCMKVLLNCGARIEVRTHQGETPFFIACKYNRLDIVNALLEIDESVIHTSNNEGVTPLHMACTDQNFPLAKILLENNANINAEDNSGLTPLQESVMKENFELCKLLLENGANLNSREYDGHLAFHFSCITGNIGILRLLIEHYKGDLLTVIDSTNCCGFTPIMLAVQSKSLDIIDELLKLGANLSVVDKSCTLALHLAVHTGNLEILKVIYKATPFEAINKYCTLSEDLLRICCANENEIITQQKSLISLVVDSENFECFEYILNCGLNYDSLNCPIVEANIMPTYFDEMRSFARYGPHQNFEVRVNLSDGNPRNGLWRFQAVLLHPISFILKQKMADLGKETIKYLKLMLESGFTFNCDYSQYDDILVVHPFEAMMFSYQVNGKVLKETVLRCLSLLLKHGFSPDFLCDKDEKNPIPIVFVYACRFPLAEILPCLLQHSNLVDLDDLLHWIVQKMFMRNDSPPYLIEQPLINAYKYLTQYTSKTVKSFESEIRQPEYESRYDSIITLIDTDKLQSLKIMCRSVVRKVVKDSCKEFPHQLKVRLNSLELPSSLISFLNYNDFKKSPLVL